MKKLSLILALLLLFALVGCGGEKPEPYTPPTSSQENEGQTNTETNNGGTSENAGNGSENVDNGETDGTAAKTLYGDYVAEDGAAYSFNETLFTYESVNSFCLRGTYSFKETEDGKLRILLTVEYTGVNVNSFAPVAQPYVLTTGDDEGLAFYEGADYIKIDLTKYTLKK